MASSSSNEQPIDRISSLPDALLLHILSFLDMSQAVQTGILSSRWMGLWTAIPSLDFDQYQYRNYKGYNPFAEHFEACTGFFDYDDFTRYNEFDDSDDFGFGFGHGFGHVDVDDDGDVGGNADDFIKFVEHSLVLHVAPKIHRFSLTFDYSKKFESFLDGWILSAVRRDVKELYLEFPVCIDDLCKLPSWLFKCKSLVSLSLNKCPIGVPKSVCFSSLLSLTITWIRMEVGSIPALIAGSPLLEELVLDKCELSSGRLRILPSSPSSELRLKRLTVTICSNQSGDEIGLELRAPNLEMLNLCGVKPYKNSLRNLISLREAYLDIYCSKVNPQFHPTLESWLKDLQHVRLLALSSSCLKVLSFMGELYRPSYDSKTKCLMLESELESLELRGIANLLWRSHDLENLIIKLSPSLFFAPDLRPDNDFDNGYWGRHKFSFPCVERRLTTVKISGFMGRKFRSAVGRKTLRRFFVKQDKEIELVPHYQHLNNDDADDDDDHVVDDTVTDNADDFIKFVERSLVLHVSPKVNKFSLTCDYSKKFDSFIDRWILSAVRRDVEDLNLVFPEKIDGAYNLPSWQFKCECLISLSLDGCSVGVPKYVCLNSLLSLTLSWICLEVGSVPALLDGCPLLEELVLDKCELSSGRLRILPSSSSGLRLNRLTQACCSNQSGDETGLEVHAPHLEILSLRGVKVYKNSLRKRNVLPLTEAYLVFYFSSWNPKLPHSLELWLQDLHNVKVLGLSSCCIKV
ncbi:hypothetical protein MRB53_030914 [Persea americana]|uniref:Uncharacterized protein n=1 Tax=Persea americana TaxID=3435 RepID=A0ACC2KN56_PERAE|nr:hypothetical protein MRB53_030914 [Persea americana]